MENKQLPSEPIIKLDSSLDHLLLNHYPGSIVIRLVPIIYNNSLQIAFMSALHLGNRQDSYNSEVEVIATNNFDDIISHINHSPIYRQKELHLTETWYESSRTTIDRRIKGIHNMTIEHNYFNLDQTKIFIMKRNYTGVTGIYEATKYDRERYNISTSPLPTRPRT